MREGRQDCGRAQGILRAGCLQPGFHRRPSYAELEGLVAAQAAADRRARGGDRELRARLAENSRNSSRPPSSDG